NTTAITISQDGFDTYQTYYGLDNAKIIENGRPRIHITSDYDRIRTLYKKPNEYLLVHLGRVIDVKNQKLLIEAVQLFNSISDKKCCLLIVGAIRDEQLYQSLLQICQDDEHITFLGQQSNVADYLSIADAFCLSSHYEGMPMSIIESFSVGCVPMSTPVGGIPEMISNGTTGFLSKDSTVESYSQAIKECLTANNLDEIRNNCFNEYKNKYSIDICGTKHWNLYRNV
ncbi:MAG TPA: glycosyltransferase, partial [Dyadobacter sp.]|nr:glycosyltransferase [Dyadobacter sp.]